MALNKYFVATLFCLASTFVCYGQNLRIELSIEWDHKHIFLRGYKDNQRRGTPYLIITYYNLGQHDIYFKKISGNRYNENLLPIACDQPFMFMHSIVPIRTGKAKYLHIVTNPPSSLFEIDMSNSKQQYFNKMTRTGQDVLYHSWEIRTQKDSLLDLFTALDIEIINEILSRQLFLNEYDPCKQLVFFDYPNKETIPYLDTYKKIKAKNNFITFSSNSDTTRFPVEEFKNDFCFLKKGDKYIEKINLLPLMLIGGSYTFTLINHVFKRYIYIYPTDEPEYNRFIKFLLPKQIDGYQLYTDNFIANDISISFDSKNNKGFLVIGKKD